MSRVEKCLKPFDASGAFRPGAEGDQLRRVAMRSAAVTVSSQGLIFALQLVSTMVLARLLVPADFGVVTMVTTFSLLLMSFGLNGFTEAVLQREEINHLLVSNLFWINLGFGLALTIGFAFSGSLLGRFYGNPHVAHVAAGMSLTILLTSTSVLHLALMKRGMRFTAVSATDILGRAVSVIVSIALGWAGWGYWALVVGNVSQPLVSSIGAWSLCRWVPGRPRRVSGTGDMVRFAVNIYGRFSVNYCARNTDNLLVGWRFDAHALGFYKKAYDLFVLPANQIAAPISAVVISALSRFNQDRAQYKRYFLSGLAMLAFVGMGLGAALTLVGKDLIRLLLGPNWEMAGRIFTYFGPGIGMMLIYNTHGLVHLSSGRPDRWFRWGLIEFAVTFLLFLVALPWGPIGIALAWTTSFWILTVPAFWYAGKPIGLGIDSVLAVVWRYLVASLLASVACIGIKQAMPGLMMAPGLSGVFARIATTSLLFWCLYLGSVALLYGGFEPLRQVWKLLRDLSPFAKASSRFAVVEGSGVVSTGVAFPPTGTGETS